jgi:hypothetical protein
MKIFEARRAISGTRRAFDSFPGRETNFKAADALRVPTGRGRSMSHSNSRATDAPDEAALDVKVLDAIGRALKAHYDDLVKAPLPDRFLDLLSDLESEESRPGRRGGADASR